MFTTSVLLLNLLIIINGIDVEDEAHTDPFLYPREGYPLTTIVMNAHINSRKKWNSNLKVHKCGQKDPRHIIDVNHNTTDTGVNLTTFVDDILSIQFTCTHDFDLITTNQFITKRDDYTYIPDLGYYKFHDNQASWHDAWKTCDEEEAYLVIINSQAEADQLVNFLNIKSTVMTDEFIHIGFHDLYSTGLYTTVKGDRLSVSGYSKWRSNEPSSVGVERCGSIDRQGLLNDVTCESIKSFLCEKDYN